MLASTYSNTISLNLVQRPDRQNYVIAYFDSLTSITEAALPDYDSWSLPSGSGVIVCATQSNNSSKSDQLTPTFTAYPSYASLRGAA